MFFFIISLSQEKRSPHVVGNSSPSSQDFSKWTEETSEKKREVTVCCGWPILLLAQTFGY